MMKTIFNIFKNEFCKMLKDSGSLLVMVFGVFMYALFYTVPFSNHIVREVPLGVVDNDNSKLSAELIRNLDSSELIQITSRHDNLNDMQKEYYKNKVRGYVFIPKDFERNIKRGSYSQISVFADSAYLIIYKQLSTGLMTTVGTMNAKLEIGKLIKKGVNKQLAFAVKIPFDFIQIPLYNPSGSYQNYVYPLVLILILQQTLLVGAGILGGTAREMFSGTKIRVKNEVWDVKNDSFCRFSKKPPEIVLGKALAYFSLYFVYSIICFLIFPAIFCYEMTYNIVFWLIMLVPFLLSTAFLAQVLVYFYSNRETALLVLVVTSLPMIFLAGFIWPKEFIPTGLIVLSKLIPATPAISGFVKVNQMGANLAQVNGEVINLYLLCIIYFILACIVTQKIQKRG